MVTDARMTRTDDLNKLLVEVTGELIVTGVDNGDGVIVLPTLYPGGSPVSVRIRRDGDLFIVSDHGAGFIEAEHLGGPQFYNRIAPRVAADYGVKYDGNMMFALEVRRDWLANGVIHVGMASRRAVDLTAEKMAEERIARDSARLREMLLLAFKDTATFDVEFRGRSTKLWNFAAMVRQADHMSFFDLVSPHHVSINTAVVKFHDVSQLDDAPRSIAVLTNPQKMDTADVSLIAEAASKVLPITIEIEALKLAA